jgi:hypothetical protein
MRHSTAKPIPDSGLAVLRHRWRFPMFKAHHAAGHQGAELLFVEGDANHSGSIPSRSATSSQLSMFLRAVRLSTVARSRSRFLL